MTRQPIVGNVAWYYLFLFFSLFFSFSNNLSIDSELNSLVLYFVIIFIVVLRSRISIEELLVSFSLSGVIATIIFFSTVSPMSFFSATLSSDRVVIGNFHPNTIGFVFLGFLGGAVSLSFLIPRYKYFFYIIAFLDLLIVFFSKSRGSLVAMFFSSCILYLISVMKNKDGFFNGKTISKVTLKFVLFILSLISILTILYFFNSDKVEAKIYQMYTNVDVMLRLSSNDAGLDSGFTGRTYAWQDIINQIIADPFMFLSGVGYRNSSITYDQPIDNGYLVVAYENGVITFLLFIFIVLKKMVSLASKRSTTLNVNNVLLWLIIAFLINNIVARYLLAIGNPFSLFILFLLFMNVNEVSVGVTNENTHLLA